jgi:hypothetical protein
MTKIKKAGEVQFEYPNDIPVNLDKDRLYASGPKGERPRNFLIPFFTYFHILEDNGINPKTKEAMLKGLSEECKELLPYIQYWLKKVE